MKVASLVRDSSSVYHADEHTQHAWLNIGGPVLSATLGS